MYVTLFYTGLLKIQSKFKLQNFILLLNDTFFAIYFYID